MKKLIMLLILLGSSITSCKTVEQSQAIELPPTPEKVVLTTSSVENEAILIIQLLRWKIWANSVKFLTNEIDFKTYEAENNRLIKLLNESI